MNFSKLNSFTIFGIGAFVYFWIIQPAMQLFVVPLNYWVNVGLTIFGCSITLFVVVNALITSAEPYEMDRIKRYGLILYGVRPTSLELIVGVLGYLLMDMSRIGLSETKDPSHQTMFIVVMMTALVLIILSLKWYQDTLVWRNDIERYRIPKGDWL